MNPLGNCAECGEQKPCACIQIAPHKNAIIELLEWVEHDMECPAFMEPNDECKCGAQEAAEAVTDTLRQLVEEVQKAIKRLQIEAAIPDIIDAFAETPAPPSTASSEGVMREAAFALLEACTAEFGWSPTAADADPAGGDRDCAITWGHLRRLSAALTHPHPSGGVEKCPGSYCYNVRGTVSDRERALTEWVRKAMRFVDLCDADAAGYDDLHENAERLTIDGYSLFGAMVEFDQWSLADLEHRQLTAFIAPTDPSGEVERVATAIALEIGRHGDTERIEMQRARGEWRDYERHAKAAIAALRSPQGGAA